MRILVGLVIAGSVVLAAAPARAQPGDDYDSDSGEPPGEAISSVDVFYDQLSPYGYWVQDPQAGTVFIPSQDNYVPYRDGHWDYTDVGLVWTSNEPFAWATSHYGRWFFSNTFSRWGWVPDTTWGPSWVDWRETDGYFGWAPLPPEGLIDAGYTVPLFAWAFAPSAHLCDAGVSRFFVPRARVEVLARSSRPIQSFRNVGNRRVIAGPPATMLRQRGVTVQQRQIQPRQMGRFTPTELRTVETRARTNAPAIEQRNQQRVEANPRLHSAKPAAPTPREETPRAEPQHAQPTRPEPQRTEPTRPEPEHAQPTRPEPQRTEPTRPEPQHAQPTRPEPQHAQPTRPEPRAVEPKPTPMPSQPSRTEPKPAPMPTAPPRTEPKPAPMPTRPEPRATPPAPAPTAPPPTAPRAEPHATPPQPQPPPHAEPHAAPQPQPQPPPHADPHATPPQPSHAQSPSHDEHHHQP